LIERLFSEGDFSWPLKRTRISFVFLRAEFPPPADDQYCEAFGHFLPAGAAVACCAFPLDHFNASMRWFVIQPYSLLPLGAASSERSFIALRKFSTSLPFYDFPPPELFSTIIGSPASASIDAPSATQAMLFHQVFYFRPRPPPSA